MVSIKVLHQFILKLYSISIRVYVGYVKLVLHSCNFRLQIKEKLYSHYT